MRVLRRVVPCVVACVGIIGAACGGGSTESAGANRPDVVPIVCDDYRRALDAARSRGTLLFVDAWAPWCPPCRFFHEEVLHDARLERFLPYYVFATIDTEQPTSVDFNASYRQRVWPTLYVIDPSQEEVVARLEGAPTFSLFARFLDRALTRWRRRGAPNSVPP